MHAGFSQSAAFDQGTNIGHSKFPVLGKGGPQAVLLGSMNPECAVAQTNNALVEGSGASSDAPTTPDDSASLQPRPALQAGTGGITPTVEPHSAVHRPSQLRKPSHTLDDARPRDTDRREAPWRRR
jgi:hypothetical protein